MSTEVVTTTELLLNPSNPREREIMLVEREFSLMQRKAKALSAADVLPKQYQDNVPNCMIAMEMAQRLHTGEMEIMQNLYIVHGNPAFSAKYLIALVNKSGILQGRLRFEFVGAPGTDEHGCYAYGTDRETGEVLKGTVITIGMAKKEGWYGKNGSKWPTMTEQMLAYRAASFWSRIYAPDATMGMHTVEEVEEYTEKVINPKSESGITGSVQDMLGGKSGKVASIASPKNQGEAEEHAKTIVDEKQNDAGEEEQEAADGCFGG